ncbi:MAG: Cys-tRNA(Pro) deacylase [Desulfotalea sp.]
MTPAILVAKRAKVEYKIHEYKHDSRNESYGLEAAEKMNVDPMIIFKTLVVDTGDSLAVAIIPVENSLNLKKIASALKCKKAAMADKQKVQKVTGYVLGGVSPLGQKKSLPTVIDKSAKDLANMMVSAGKRGLEIELAPHDLALLTKATFTDLIA